MIAVLSSAPRTRTRVSWRPPSQTESSIIRGSKCSLRTVPLVMTRLGDLKAYSFNTTIEKCSRPVYCQRLRYEVATMAFCLRGEFQREAARRWCPWKGHMIYPNKGCCLGPSPLLVVLTVESCSAASTIHSESAQPVPKIGLPRRPHFGGHQDSQLSGATLKSHPF
jgi:hypothetical protein